MTVRVGLLDRTRRPGPGEGPGRQGPPATGLRVPLKGRRSKASRRARPAAFLAKDRGCIGPGRRDPGPAEFARRRGSAGRRCRPAPTAARAAGRACAARRRRRAPLINRVLPRRRRRRAPLINRVLLRRRRSGAGRCCPCGPAPRRRRLRKLPRAETGRPAEPAPASAGSPDEPGPAFGRPALSPSAPRSRYSTRRRSARAGPEPPGRWPSGAKS